MKKSACLGGDFKIFILYLKIYSGKSILERGERGRGWIRGTSLSGLDEEHDLWVRYITNVVTESDLWMSALLSHSGCSFKVFSQHWICSACCSAVMRAGLHLVRPDVSEDSVKIFFAIFSSAFLHFFLYSLFPHITLQHMVVMWNLLFIYCRIAADFRSTVLTAAWILGRSAGTFPVFCLFHTWLVFVFSFRHHPLTQTHT